MEPKNETFVRLVIFSNSTTKCMTYGKIVESNHGMNIRGNNYSI